MKCKCILFFIVLICTLHTVKGQDNLYNFSVVKNEIVWQKVYDSTLNVDQLHQQIKSSGLFENVERDENTFRGVVNNLFPIFNGAHYGIIPNFISSNFFNGFVVIEYKTGRYRVTVKNIILRSHSINAERLNITSPLEKHAFIRGNAVFSHPFIRAGAEILDFTFEEKFNFAYSGDEDW